MRPFVFIAGFPRSGSTAVAEMLTEWPRTFIQSEPGLTQGKLHLYALERLAEPFASSVSGALSEARRVLAETKPGGDILRAYLRRVVPLLPFEQVGIKEVAFRRFLHRAVLEERPDARVVVTVRDPRDLWLSLEEMAGRYDDPLWSYRGLGPDEAAERVEGIFRQVVELVERGALVVRYEALCTDPAIAAKLLEFVESPVAAGSFGLFTSDRRNWEIDRHGGVLSSRSVGRWRSADPQARQRAERFAERLGAYRERFGYG
jgi:hypothetical protein